MGKLTAVRLLTFIQVNEQEPRRMAEKEKATQDDDAPSLSQAAPKQAPKRSHAVRVSAATAGAGTQAQKVI